ncbi:MAG: exodeoxyribonuclease VII small subunit [Ruminococcus sp.]|nr:exodeoxyribonuclease VII small subunit [Ruminococcus sp.]
MTFEEKMTRLGEITEKLEKDNPSLNESLDLYKEGVALCADCKKELEEAKLTVKNMDGEKTDE